MAEVDDGPGTTGEPEGDERPRTEIDRPLGHLNRRTFLQGAGVLGAAGAVDAVSAYARLITNPGIQRIQPVIGNLLGELESIISDTKPTFSTLLRRREDFLFLRIDGYNLVHRGQALVRDVGGHPAYLVITFEPQHVTEQAFVDPGQTPAAPGNSRALLAYPSRIAFSLPSGRAIPLTVAGLLDWARLDPSLSPSAAYNPLELAADLTDLAKPGHGGTSPVKLPKPQKVPALANPTDVQTAIELPWHLVISPTSVGGSWSHPREALTSQGYTELWHTRLATDAAEAAADGGVIRAVWNYDTLAGTTRPTLAAASPPSASDQSPFRTSLTEWDRWEIVNATSNFQRYQKYGRADVTANRLWLSTRGGFLDVVGDWNSTHFDIAEWKHQATLGRDQYVKVVTKGFLFPFGHRAVYTVVTERKFEEVDGEIVATSRQYMYVVIREPTVSYGAGATFGIANDARDFPFRSLTITTARTPDLPVQQNFLSSNTGFEGDPFVPSLGKGDYFLWHFVGTDWLGQQVEFTAPGVFVYQQDGFTPTNCTKVRNAYNALPVTDARRVGNFTGQEVAFAESYTPGDTNLGVQSITFGAGIGEGPISGTSVDSAFQNADQPICYPNLAQADVVLSAAAQASGGTPLANPTVSYHPTYVSGSGGTGGGFNTGVNKGNVYLQILSSTLPSLSFGSGSSGGLITPNLSLSGISRSLGPVAGSLDNLLGGTFDPTSVFENALNATILGGVKLSTLIEAVSDFSGDSPIAQIMQIVYSTAGGAGAARDLRRGASSGAITPPVPTTKTTHFHWEPNIDPDQTIPIVTSTGDTSFVLDGVVTTNLAQPALSMFSLTGTLTNFAVSLMSTDTAEFITINFDSLAFTSGTNQKSHVTVDIDTVEFDGPLKFIEQLEEFMDFSGDGGPKIQILPTGISADLSVALPPIGVGVFSLSNIAIDAGFNLPFTGGPARFRFSFSTQDNPFTLSVAIFGGGGFFGIAIGTDGVELIQASFDFGAMASIDLGVASGSVQLVAGIYFSYGENNGMPPTTCILTGFVKLDGSLSILGIITLSLTFDLSLTYEDSGGVSSVTGTATLTVSVSVLFFSFSVSVTATKTFGGGQSNSSVGSDRHGRLTAHNSGTDVPPNFTDQMTATNWSSYCSAFATD